MNLLNHVWPLKLPSLFKRTAKNEDGILTVEALIMLPLLFWSIWASYNFFDGYRQSARNLKATYALADIVSRERSTITSGYLSNLYQILNIMVPDGSHMNMRISFILFDKANDIHEVEWSCPRGDSFVSLTESEIIQLKNKLPEMPDNGKMILVETMHVYERPYKFLWGEDELIMENFVFTHPRVYDNINADPC